MRKIIVTILLLPLFATVTAQDSQDQVQKKATENRLKPVDGDWGFTFNITGLISNLKPESNKDMLGHEIIFVRHYLKDDLALRVGFGLNSTKNTTVQNDSIPQNSTFVEFDSVFSKTDFFISAGVEKHLSQLKRLDPYIGAEILIQFIGKEKSSWTTTQTDASGPTKIDGEYKLEGGSGIGFFGILGFNYFMTQKIAIGAEYRFGYNYMKSGGDYSYSEITTPASGSQTSVFDRGKHEQRSAGLQVNSSGNIVFSIFF